jgi:dGTPase
VVEAACLAHDLGHPPFGHVGEETLNELVLEHDSDGYEGNAQTFRIITKLSVRFADEPGLDLTRATLAACLKYPWYRNPARPHQEKKWSAYRSEEDDFDFARQFHSTENKTAEAELMDWADDIAFSVHDLEDFHRCGAIPWPLILSPDNESRLVSRVKTNWFAAPVDAEGRIRDALRSLTDLMSVFGAVVNERYEGTRDQRLQLRTLTSRLIGRYIRAVRLDASIDAPKAIIINPEEAVEVLVLKQITRDYVISSPSLAAQQYGQQRILRDLFDA